MTQVLEAPVPDRADEATSSGDIYKHTSARVLEAFVREVAESINAQLASDGQYVHTQRASLIIATRSVFEVSFWACTLREFLVGLGLIDPDPRVLELRAYIKPSTCAVFVYVRRTADPFSTGVSTNARGNRA